ncbi:MAG: aspartate carbamoyltransferase [Candidatus Eremiobacterota bacterium]
MSESCLLESRLKRRSLVSIRDFTREDIELVLNKASQLEGRRSRDLEGRQVALLFYENSTRTRNSFVTAVHHLGGTVCGFDSAEGTSVQKGETLYDTIQMFSAYCDAIVLRHPRDGSARWASDTASVPVINAGDGKNQHPTQTLLDLYAFRATQGRMEGLRVAMVGDLKYGRTVHSLSDALAMFPGNVLHYVSPPSLSMPAGQVRSLRERGVEVHEHESLDCVLGEADVIYVTRIQRERMPDETEYEQVRGAYRLTASMLRKVKPNLRILHPLPRVDEIAPDVDPTPYAYYFQQAAGGVPVRKAVMWLLLGLGG